VHKVIDVLKKDTVKGNSIEKWAQFNFCWAIIGKALKNAPKQHVSVWLNIF
jgi:hypothetical protein